jgi:hypothetical protein
MHRFLDHLAFVQPYLIGLLLLVLIALVTPGCATAGAESAGRTRSLATTAVATSAGGYIGAREGGGKARNAAIGAAAGFVAGEAINFFNNKAQREAYLAGYEKGQSNAIKQQYWVARDNQRPAVDDGYEETYYEIDVPPSDRAGVRREATKRVIRVVAPKGDSGP